MMDPVLAFLVVIVAISFVTIRYRSSPFLVLVCGAIAFGLLTGMGEAAVTRTAEGAGQVFTLFCIPIFSGAVIARVLLQGGYLADIIAGLRRVTSSSRLTAAAAGYLLSIPFMCCITAFIVSAPLVKELDPDPAVSRRLLYTAAFSSVISFVLLYPLPVMYAVSSEFGMTASGTALLAAGIPLSLLITAAGVLTLSGNKEKIPDAGQESSRSLRPVAWVPILVPVLLMAFGIAVPGASLVGNINVALLSGAITALVIAPSPVRQPALEKATRNAGIIMLDICGAGALGTVVASGEFSSEIVSMLTPLFPIIVIPFILATLVQAASGSRLVTSVIAASLVHATPAATLPFIPLALMIAAGTMTASYLSDPYFWLIRSMTGDKPSVVMRHYTLPLAVAGIAVFCTALAMTILMVP
jgi:GntP family gluconate:H+ symporter